MDEYVSNGRVFVLWCNCNFQRRTPNIQWMHDANERWGKQKAAHHNMLCSSTYRVVDNDGTIVTLGNVPRMLEGKVTIDGQEHNVAFPCLVLLEQLDLNVAESGSTGAAGAAAGAKDAKLAHGEGGLFETADDLLADGTGGTDDADGVRHAEGSGGADGGGRRTSDERGAGGAACEGRCGRAGTGERYGRSRGKGLGAGECESSCSYGEDAVLHR